ncbi:MAG: RNA polymerase sigma factor SigJ, partial [Candidatus Eremiobacteraeota bacterium]|nr:RNA polymerase sigma factor SigJ [Candidatus Eremiobacteraeota bacterium]
QLYVRERATLVRHAYRMLGSMSDAEDVVQDAFERMQRTDTSHVRDPRKYLRATVTNLSLDRLRSSARQREVYVGPWLPEPVVDESAVPEHVVGVAEDISYAFLLALERLSPLERAAFLMHDALDVPFAEIAQTLGRTEESVRRLASRARVAIQSETPRRIARPADAEALRDKLGAAVLNDDVAGLMAMLTDDVTFLSDGGGKRAAAIVPVTGRDRVTKMLTGLAKKGYGRFREVLPTWINGLPGWAFFTDEGLEQTLAVETDGTTVSAIYVMRNPDKLSAVEAILKPRA